MEGSRIEYRPRQCGSVGRPVEPYRAKERALIAQLTIELIRTIYDARLGTGGPFHAGEIENLMLSGAVLLAQVNGRPKNASDLARTLNIPRVTTLRKLRALQRAGMIVRRGGKYYMAELKPGQDDYIDKCLALIRRAAQP